MTKHLSEALQICKNISNRTYQIAIQRLTEWTESAYGVNVYLDEEENYFIPTPIEEIEELDYNFGDIEIAKDQPYHIKIFSLLHEAGHAMDYISYIMGEKKELNTIDKELSAWDAGEEIAKKVNFILDKDDWTGYKDICIKLYMEE
jgi:hypothetical protein